MTTTARSPRRRRHYRASVVHLTTHFDPLTLAGIVLSIAMAVALDLTNVASPAESLLAGLLGTTIALVLDASARAERRFELRHLVRGRPWLGDALTSMAQLTREILDRYPGTEIEADARRRLERLIDELDELRRGRIVQARHDHDHLIAATEACRERIEAVTNILDEPTWWHSPIGQRYWQANVAALARGVAITRIVVCERLTTKVVALVESQRRAGANVTVVDRRHVDPALHLNVVVWDRRRAWEGRMNAHGDIVANVFVVNEAEVDRVHGIYRACAAASRMPGIAVNG
ncbi:MAG TPA: hypothetical protein VFM55_15840 [Micromonosporaceae bacterium]|nr:hypothetical protein [Micromonosporaceae bacterium]